MKERRIDSEIVLVPYYPNYEAAFEWYQDKALCKQVDNIDFTYSMDRLKAMYSYLSTHGECYYIQFCGVLVGDVTLRNDGEISIVVCREYQNRHIGRKCVIEMIKLAREKGFSQVKANIYSFNEQSRKMFTSVGFKQTEEEWFVCEL